jgi:hypothetical protein
VLIHDGAAILICPDQQDIPIHAHLRETLDRGGRVVNEGMMTSSDVDGLARAANQYPEDLMIRLPNNDEYTIRAFGPQLTDGRCSVTVEFEAAAD